MDSDISDLISRGCKKAEDFIVLGKYKEAEVVAAQILRVDPNCYNAKLALGFATAKLGDIEKGKEILENCIKQDPNNFRAYNNLGLIHSDTDKAIYYFGKAASLSEEISPQINYAIEIAKIGKEEEAEKEFRRLSVLSNTAKFNFAGFLHKRNRLEEAEIFYREVLYTDPNFHIARFNLGALCLSTGRLKEGYELTEARWNAFNHLAEVKKQIPLPFWDGSPNKTVILFCEQGLGDYIQFLRYAPKVAETCRVILQIGESLKYAISGFDFYYGQKADCCISVCSLPKFFDFEIPKPIKINHSKVDFSHYSESKKGLCWCGSLQHPDDNERSIPLSSFNTIVSQDQNSKWFTCGWASGKWENGANMPIVDTSSFQKDVFSVAGIIHELDYVVTVDTACAHIAGSMGKKTYLLLPYNSDWRWRRANNTSWYESVEIIRQKRRNDWGSVICDLQSRIKA
jgi:tetratricopeptide (TPR) repeat protein